jgi:hypothetical protein
MSRPATSRLKVNPQVGQRPTLEFRRLYDLKIDASYQRSIEIGTSQALIRRIAMYWDWSLCQPLAVARRADGALMVVDGQHRLAAARLRGDIYDLPCVITAYESAAEEAAAFVALNQQRRPLGALDLFRAALAAGDEESAAIHALIAGAGLSLAPHSNCTAWAPGQVSNIGGIRHAYKRIGGEATSAALRALGSAFAGQVLQYAGSIFLPLARCYARFLKDPNFDADLFVDVIAGATQREWVQEMLHEKAAKEVDLRVAGETVFARAYGEAATEMDAAA